MCDLCFKPIFDREFYVFPCQHAFHRMCIQNKLGYYKTKDIEVKVMLDKLKGCFGQIDSIRDQAQLIAQQSNQSAMGGAFSSTYDQDRSQSYLNDITTITSSITSFVQKGMANINAGQTALNIPGVRQQTGGGLNQNVMHALKEKDERAIRDKLVSDQNSNFGYNHSFTFCRKRSTRSSPESASSVGLCSLT